MGLGGKQIVLALLLWESKLKANNRNCGVLKEEL